METSKELSLFFETQKFRPYVDLSEIIANCLTGDIPEDLPAVESDADTEDEVLGPVSALHNSRCDKFDIREEIGDKQFEEVRIATQNAVKQSKSENVEQASDSETDSVKS